MNMYLHVWVSMYESIWSSFEIHVCIHTYAQTQTHTHTHAHSTHTHTCRPVVQVSMGVATTVENFYQVKDSYISNACISTTWQLVIGHMKEKNNQACRTCHPTTYKENIINIKRFSFNRIIIKNIYFILLSFIFSA